MKTWHTIAIILFVLGCSDPETATFDRFYFRTDGADLAVEINGNIASKTFIIFLHGGPGGGSLDYNSGPYQDILEDQYAVVYLDQRGQGASKGKYSESDVTLQTFSNDIYNLARFLIARYDTTSTLFLLGHSWGGTTGTHALLNTQIQDLIAGWIEADGAHDIPWGNIEIIEMINTIGGEEIAAGRNAEQWQEWIDYCNSLDTSDISISEGGKLNQIGFQAEGLIEDINDPIYGDYKYSISKDPDWSWAVFESNNKTADAILIETENTSLAGELSRIEIPTLLLWGKYDFVVPPALGDSADRTISDSRLVIFENSGHSPMDNEPVAFAQEIIDFVEEVKSDTTRTD